MSKDDEGGLQNAFLRLLKDVPVADLTELRELSGVGDSNAFVVRWAEWETKIAIAENTRRELIFVVMVVWHWEGLGVGFVWESYGDVAMVRA